MKTQNKPTIADALWLGANKYLRPTSSRSPFDGMRHYSCCAALAGACELALEWPASTQERIDFEEEVGSFLSNLGVLTDGYDEFMEFGRNTTKAQGARYLWLMFAHEVAKSERK